MDDKVRLIDASAVCEKLREIIEEYERRIPDYSANDVLGNGKKAARKWGNKADGIEKAISVINAAPTIEAEPDNGWISVKDRLPDGDGNVYYNGLEESKYVLVYGCYKDDYGYGIGTYIRDHIEHDAGWSGCLSGLYELDCCNVTHWQYLPEPPKGE